MRKIETVKENYINKQKNCYCWIDEEEECFNENSCIECSLEYAQYTINKKERETNDIRILNPEKLKKPDKDIGAKCFGCEYFRPGKKIWSNRCDKHKDFCRKAFSYCDLRK